MNTEALRHMACGPGGAGITCRAIPPADQRVHRSRPANRRAAAGDRGAAGQRRTGLDTGGAVTRQLAGNLLSAGQLTTESPRLDYALLNSLFSTPDLEEG